MKPGVKKMQFGVRVRTSAKKFAISYKNNTGIIIHATEKAQRNRVNIEITKELTLIFNLRVIIRAGLNSRDKIIEVEGNEEEILQRLHSIF